MVSMRVTVMAATLVTLAVLCINYLFFLFTAYIFCCRRYVHRKIPFSEIKGFSLQKSTDLCPVRAIIFHTKNGKRCADPSLKWVMDYVSYILKSEECHKVLFICFLRCGLWFW
uniref:C-C motif chemokine n=1 Tax=Poecilia mexicana TaxID=48701 RepID=A0A3B3WK61_9TELE